VALGRIGGQVFAFIGLERIGGIMVYDVTDPYRATFVDYLNHRDFSVNTRLPNGSTNPAVGDLGPEGLAFVPARNSPNKQPLLLVGNEVSGGTTVYQVKVKDLK